MPLNRDVQAWFDDPEFKAIPTAEKERVLGRFFDQKFADQISEVPPDKQPELRSNFIEDNLAPHRPAPPSRGILGDVGATLGRGVIGAGELGARAVATVDQLQGGTGEAARRVAQDIAGWRDDTLPQSAEAQADTVRGTVTRGAESAVQSLAAAVPAVAIGAATGGVGGAAAGYVLGAPLFGLAQYDTALEKYTKKGVGKEDAHNAALLEAAAETGGEMFTNLLEAMTVGAGGMLSKPLKEAAKNGVRRVIGSTWGMAGKKAATVAGLETVGELATAGAQGETEYQYGVGKERFLEAAKSQFGEIAVAGLIFGALGGGLHKARTGHVKKALTDTETPMEVRLGAVQEVAGELERVDPELARRWRDGAAIAVLQGKPISDEIKDEPPPSRTAATDAPLGAVGENVTEAANQAAAVETITGKRKKKGSGGRVQGAGEQPADELTSPGIKEGLSGMGRGMADAMYDMLWQKVQAGDTTENGQPSALLQVAKAVRDHGGLQSVEELQALANDYANVQDTGTQRQAALKGIVAKYTPQAPATALGDVRSERALPEGVPAGVRQFTPGMAAPAPGRMVESQSAVEQRMAARPVTPEEVAEVAPEAALTGVESLTGRPAASIAAGKPLPQEAAAAPVEKASEALKHYTLPERAAAIRKEGYRPDANLPVFGTGSKDQGPKVGRFAGDALYLSRDDETWGKYRELDPTGEPRPATDKDTPEDGEIFFSYKDQKWMIRPGKWRDVPLEAVEFRLAPDAKVLEVSSSADVNAAQKKYGPWDSGEFWKKIGKDYDAVSIGNTKGVLERNPDDNFFASALGDQVIVLNRDKVAPVEAPAARKAAATITGRKSSLRERPIQKLPDEKTASPGPARTEIEDPGGVTVAGEATGGLVGGEAAAGVKTITGKPKAAKGSWFIGADDNPVFFGGAATVEQTSGYRGPYTEKEIKSLVGYEAVDAAKARSKEKPEDIAAGKPLPQEETRPAAAETAAPVEETVEPAEAVAPENDEAVNPPEEEPAAPAAETAAPGEARSERTSPELGEIQVEIRAYSETGAAMTMKERAGVALKENGEQIDTVRRILDCLNT